MGTGYRKLIGAAALLAVVSLDAMAQTQAIGSISYGPFLAPDQLQVPVPMLSNFALFALSLLLAGAAWFVLRRSRAGRLMAVLGGTGLAAAIAASGLLGASDAKAVDAPLPTVYLTSASGGVVDIPDSITGDFAVTNNSSVPLIIAAITPAAGHTFYTVYPPVAAECQPSFELQPGDSCYMSVLADAD
jgi:hypothetical protein